MFGCIVDLVIDLINENVWYVVVGLGGVWKIINVGIIFILIFDDQLVYFIGCVIFDFNNFYMVWVGMGENVGGWYVGFGDGIYWSFDGGVFWENMGLKNFEYIFKIIVYFDDLDVIMVVLQGLLWSLGGDWGFFKFMDGGKMWKKIFGDDQYIGVIDMVYDLCDFDWVYVVIWEYYCMVVVWMGGGEKFCLYVFDDVGDIWWQLEMGLLKGKWGKIGLVIFF